MTEEESSMDDLFDSGDTDDEDNDNEGESEPEPVVQSAKQEKAFHAVLPNRKLVSFKEIYEHEENLDFLVDGILPDSGMVFIGGISATGKTILAIQMCVDLILNRPTMTWKRGNACPDQVRVVMLSLEMNAMELKRRIHDMYPDLTDVEMKILDENFIIYADPEPFEMWNVAHATELATIIKATECHLMLIDSASVCFGESLKEDKQVNQSTKYLYTIRSRMKVAMLVVAHTRKPLNGSTSPEDITINDLFGHSGVAQSASSILLLQEDDKQRRQTVVEGNGEEVDKIVHIINAKSRFGSTNAAFKAVLPSFKKTSAGEPLLFKRNAIPLQPMSPEKRRFDRGSSGMPLFEAKGKFDPNSNPMDGVGGTGGVLDDI